MASSSSPVKHLQGAMKDLKVLQTAVSASNSDKVQQLAQEVSKKVEELKIELKFSKLIRDLASLVDASEWVMATELLQNIFSTGAVRELVVKNVVALIYDDDEFIKSRENSICWLEHLTPDLQSMVSKEIYHRLVHHHHVHHEQYLLLLLLERVTKLSIVIQDKIRTHLKKRCKVAPSAQS